jgi:hypothetical protein
MKIYILIWSLKSLRIFVEMLFFQIVVKVIIKAWFWSKRLKKTLKFLILVFLLLGIKKVYGMNRVFLSEPISVTDYCGMIGGIKVSVVEDSVEHVTSDEFYRAVEEELSHVQDVLYLDLHGCVSLTKLLDLKKFKKLMFLDAHNCIGIGSVDISSLYYLRGLNFNGCSNLSFVHGLLDVLLFPRLNFVDIRGTHLICGIDEYILAGAALASRAERDSVGRAFVLALSGLLKIEYKRS